MLLQNVCDLAPAVGIRSLFDVAAKKMLIEL
jgi:hypothetical protein